MANRAIRYRLRPNEEQRILIGKTFGCCRKVWNLMLADKNAAFRETGKVPVITPARYKDEYPYLREVDSMALCNVRMNIRRAFLNYFRGLKKHQKVGYPRFKSLKRAKKSYTTNNMGGSIRIEDGGIRLPKLGPVKASLHRLPEDSWKLKSVTVTLKPDGKYYASVLFEYDDEAPSTSPDTDSALGLDYRSDGLYMDSEGNIAGSPKYYRKGRKKLRRARRKLSKMKKGSVNYERQRKKLAGIHSHIANRRKDFLHKKSTEIANRYDIVCVEDLGLRGIASREHHLGKATYDNGYGRFIDMLEYKRKDRGHYLVRVDRWYPSTQTCSKCGRRKNLRLDERVYRCECGNVMDRDLNAAANIRNEGLRILRESLQPE